jgi:diacylglycerol kinase (ATP)
LSAGGIIYYMKPDNWVDSVNCAIEGILWATSSQRHLRYHFFTAVVVLLLALFLGVTVLDFILLTFAVTLVLFAELANTAVEVVVDLVSPEFHPLARRAKDVAAGSVLVASLGAFVMGFFVFSHYLFPPIKAGLGLSEPIVPVLPVVSILVVVIAVVLLKAHFGKGRPLSGGMPSGHAAIAFSIAVSVVLAQTGMVISLLVVLVAVLVSHSRYQLRIHSALEVVLGAILGVLITLLIYLLFN